MGPRRWLSVVVCLSAHLLGCSAREPAPSPAELHASHNVVIILIDCLRADHVGAYGHTNPTTPNIDTLAADGVLFDQAIAPTNWTKPSIVSLFTGTYLSQHTITEGRLAGRADDDSVARHVLIDDLTTMAESLSAAGFATGGFVNQGHLADYLGFGQGFDIYEAELHDPEVQDHFIQWVKSLDPGRFFAYLHLLDLHFPYTPQDHIDVFNDDVSERVITPLMARGGRGFRRLVAESQLTDENISELKGLYDGLLLGMDDRVRQLIQFLKDEGLYDQTLVILTSDHGEAFFEHGYFEHGGELLYSELVRVPLIMKFPAGQYAGAVVESPVQLVDILPTTQELFGIPVTANLGGTSVIGLIEGVAVGHPVLTESTDVGGQKALYHGGHKFIFDMDTDKVEVFDYQRDLLDQVDLVDQLDPSTVEEARAVLDRTLRRNAAFAEQMSIQERPLREYELEKLRSLGYIR